MSEAYPKRPAFFSHRFCRLLFKACVANEIGPDGCWLLAVIAHTEDAKGYRGAVTFFNMQLAPLVGLGSVDALDRVRRRAVAAGWLHYSPGAKGVAGRYWVTIPEQFRDVDDAPTDENPGDYAPGYVRENAEESRREAEGKCGTIREECAEHSSLSLPLSQYPPADAGGAVAGPAPETKPAATPKPKRPAPDADPRFVRFWAEYPRKASKGDAVKAFAKLNPDAATLDAIHAALAWQTRSDQWQRDHGKYIPYPASWLNSRRWEDEPPRVVGPPGGETVRRMTAADVFAMDEAESGKIYAPMNPTR